MNTGKSEIENDNELTVIISTTSKVIISFSTTLRFEGGDCNSTFESTQRRRKADLSTDYNK